MNATLIYYDRLNESKITETGFRYVDTKRVPISEQEIKGETELDLFIQFYKLNNNLRYSNSYHIWQDNEWKTKYDEWLKSDDYKKRSFELYYGNGIVD